MKTLDKKLASIRAGRYQPLDFIIADAKDGDMGFGAAAPGPARGPDGRQTGALKTRAGYLYAMTEMVQAGVIDIMLASASSIERLTDAGVFDVTTVTPAVRLNDATDIWSARGSTYTAHPSRPFRTARPARVKGFSDLGLYSVTFSNDLDHDIASLDAYTAFRAEATSVGVRHFLEVFNANPALDIGVAPALMGSYVNDCIVRALAGVTAVEAPVFLKMAYNGPKALEELASYDPTGLIVGILGGAKGTTRDTFELIRQGERYGARVALFGRKINFAEHPIELVRLMRAVVEGRASSLEAVKAYHGALQKAGLVADRSLEDDSQITDPILQQG